MTSSCLTTLLSPVLISSRLPDRARCAEVHADLVAQRFAPCGEDGVTGTPPAMFVWPPHVDFPTTTMHNVRLSALVQRQCPSHPVVTTAQFVTDSPWRPPVVLANQIYIWRAYIWVYLFLDVRFPKRLLHPWFDNNTTTLLPIVRLAHRLQTCSSLMPRLWPSSTSWLPFLLTRGLAATTATNGRL